MAFIQFKSDNPQFSFLLMKNPSTGLTLRRYRLGTFFGYYSKDDVQTYNVYFRDGDDEISFKKNQDEQYEHNDFKRFNTPIFIQGVVNDFFRQHTNSEKIMEEDVIGFNNEIIINQLYMFDPKYLGLLKKYFDGFDFDYKELNKNNYQVSIKTNKKTFRDLINLIYIVSMFYHCSEKDVWIHEDEIERYVRIMNNLDAPYFLRYVIKYKVIRSINKFNHIKTELQKTNRYELEMFYGDTHGQRADFIKEIIGDSKNEILDIGCYTMQSYGMFLLKKLAKEDVLYHAVDIDQEALAKANRKAEVNSLDNLATYGSMDEFFNTENKQSLNIIMSEVFEHIELSENKKIIKNCLDKLKIEKMIITTPDKRFNVHYLFGEDDKRLDDHIFEMSDVEFQQFFDKLLSPYKNRYQYSFHSIGDKVDGISASQAIVIQRKDIL